MAVSALVLDFIAAVRAAILQHSFTHDGCRTSFFCCARAHHHCVLVAAVYVSNTSTSHTGEARLGKEKRQGQGDVPASAS